jgi:nitrite reductase/ring-hydroxylating ferredoxin subunit
LESQPRALPPTMKKHIVAKAADIAEGEKMLVEIDGRPIGIFRVDGRFYALLNRCPHLGGPLCKGDLVHEVASTVPGEIRFDASQTYVTCPWHNWEFDIRTGQSYWNPNGMRARPFPINVESGKALEAAIEQGQVERVEGPFKAETIQVDIEDDYVVVTMRQTPPRPATAAIAHPQQAACAVAIPSA